MYFKNEVAGGAYVLRDTHGKENTICADHEILLMPYEGILLELNK